MGVQCVRGVNSDSRTFSFCLSVVVTEEWFLRHSNYFASYCCVLI